MAHAPSALRPALNLISPIIVGLLIAALFRSLIAQPFTIPSSSMAPGLLTGDYILVSKFPYGWSRASLPLGRPQGTDRLLGGTVKRGDVVVFRLPRDPTQVWIKRVIGLPGDQVEIAAGEIILNQEPVPQKALSLGYDADAPTRPVLIQSEQMNQDSRPPKTYRIYEGGLGLPGDDRPPMRVPAGHYLVMGDNRDNSLDGRWPAEVGVGLVPASHLVGRAELIAWSWKPGLSLTKPWTWLNLRPDRFFRRLDQAD